MPTIDPRLTQTVALVVAGSAIVASWQVGYRGTQRHLRQRHEQRLAMRQDLDTIQQQIADAGSAFAWMSQQQRTLKELQHRFPLSRELPRVLDALLEQAATSHLELLDVKQGSPEAALLPGGGPAKLDQTSCLGVPIQVMMQGRYHHVLRYLQVLTGPQAPAVITVRDLTYQLEDPESGMLKITLQLILYVLGT